MADVLTRSYSDQARRDIRDILERTETRWGADQMVTYARNIHSTILMLCRHPEAGHIHPDLKAGQRVFGVGAHLIIYKRKGETVVIVRILHQNMSLRKHL